MMERPEALDGRPIDYHKLYFSKFIIEWIAGLMRTYFGLNRTVANGVQTAYQFTIKKVSVCLHSRFDDGAL